MTRCTDCHCGTVYTADEWGVIAYPCETCRGDGEVEGDDDDRADERFRDGEVRRGL